MCKIKLIWNRKIPASVDLLNDSRGSPSSSENSMRTTGIFYGFTLIIYCSSYVDDFNLKILRH